MNNKCTIPFFGPFKFNIDKHTIAPCCIGRSSEIDPVGGILNKDVISVRKSILENVQHEYCDKCWSIEKHGGRSLRSRISKHKTIDWETIDIDMMPNSVQLAFSNKCQLQCIYCGPHSSILWEKELGTTHVGSKDIGSVIEILKKLKLTEVVVTGGEPMLDDNCIDFLLDLDFDIKRRIVISTNLSYGEKTFGRLLEIINKHPNIVISCSIDSIGNNISRKYLNWELWDRNFKQLAQNLQIRKTQYPTAGVYATITLNLFNYKNIGDIFRYVLFFRKQNLKGIIVDLGVVGSGELSSLNSINIDKEYKVDITDDDYKLLNQKEKLIINSINNMIQNSTYNYKQAESAKVFFKKHL